MSDVFAGDLSENMRLTTASKFPNEMILSAARGYFAAWVPNVQDRSEPFDKPVRVAGPCGHHLTDFWVRANDQGVLYLRKAGGRGGISSGWKGTALFRPDRRAEDTARVTISCPTCRPPRNYTWSQGKLLAQVIFGAITGAEVDLGSMTRHTGQRRS